MNRRLYVLTHENLSPAQKAVQLGHAVAEYTLKFPENWKNEFLIYLEVKTENHLIEFINKFIDKELDFAIFQEPDLENRVTAIATVSDGRIFKGIPALQ